jgi:hypothetical protein
VPGAAASEEALDASVALQIHSEAVSNHPYAAAALVAPELFAALAAAARASAAAAPDFARAAAAAPLFDAVVEAYTALA